MPKVTLHQGRGMVKGKHNDAKREWLKDVKDTDVLARYDVSKTEENKQWTAENGESYEANFDEDIKKTYKDLYEPGLKEQNERYKKSGHSERQKTIDEWYQSKKYAPTEMILQYGNSVDDTNHNLTNEQFWECSLKMKDYIQEHYPNVKVLGVAAHFDETSPHSHLSYTVEYNGKPNLNKGLEQSGVALPNEAAKVGRFNNRGMTFTEDLRCQFEEIIKEYDKELTPHDKDTHTTTQSLAEYRARKKAEKITNEAQQEVSMIQGVCSQYEGKIIDFQAKYDEKQKEYDTLQQDVNSLETSKADALAELDILNLQIGTEQARLENLDEEINKDLAEKALAIFEALDVPEMKRKTNILGKEIGYFEGKDADRVETLIKNSKLYQKTYREREAEIKRLKEENEELQTGKSKAENEREFWKNEWYRTAKIQAQEDKDFIMEIDMDCLTDMKKLENILSDSSRMNQLDTETQQSARLIMYKFNQRQREIKAIEGWDDIGLERA